MTTYKHGKTLKKKAAAFLRGKITIRYTNTEMEVAYLMVLLLALVFSTLYGMFIIYKHNVFYSYAWDLGIFAQALKSTLEGKWFYHTPQLFVLPNGNHMDLHFTPILLLLLPIYALIPRPETLLAIKAFVSFAAMIPLYLIARKLLANEIAALCVSLLYALYPPLHGALTFDFQPQCFLPLFIFLADYAYVYHRPTTYAISLVLTAFTSEHGALLAAVLVVIHVLKHYTESRRVSIRELTILAALLTYLTIVAYYLDYVQTVNTTPEFREFLRAYDNWKVLGYRGNTFLMIHYIITNPSKALEALKYDFHVKFFNMMLTYGTLAFMPIFSIYGLASLGVQLPFLLSNNRAYYSIGAHYPYYYIPYVILGLVYSLAGKGNPNKDVLKASLVASVIALVSTALWSPLAVAFIKETNILWYPIIKVDSVEVESLKKLVNFANSLNRPLLTQNHIFPHTTLSPQVYVIPLQSVYDYNISAARKYIDSSIKNVDIILIDFSRLSECDKYVLEKAVEKGFRPYGFGFNSILLSDLLPKNVDEAIYGLEYHFIRTYYAKDLPRSKYAVLAYDEEYGDYVARFNVGKRGHIVYGPYTYLVSGSYEARFYIKVNKIDTSYEGPILLIDVVADKGETILANKVFSAFQIPEHNRHLQITLSFTVNKTVLVDVEFRVYSFGAADIAFYKSEVVLKKAISQASFSERSYLSEDLRFDEGVQILNNLLIVNASRIMETKYVWWGPYDVLPKGTYNVKIYLKLEPRPANESRVMIIDVVYNRGMSRVVEMHVLGQDLIPIRNGWYVISLRFTLHSDVRDLEIRCLKLSKEYALWLSHIDIGIHGD